MGRTIEDIKVVDVEKRKIPSKHYVYVIYVTWSDSSTNVIYRRYCRFFDFQSKIMEVFPEDAGTVDPEKRIIPFLPGKKLFGRSHIREVAVKRMGPIAEYCKAIVNLPRRISQCKEVRQFFELEPDDINPPKGKKASIKGQKISGPKSLEVYIAVADYKKQEKGEVTLQAGMLVEIVEKTETGWWFVNVEDEQGWVPSTCLERDDGVKEDSTVKFKAGEEEQYLCTEEFQAASDDELSMDRGAVVDVLEKNLEGWWRVRYNGKEGYVPATYLMKTESFKIRKNKLERKGKGGPEIVKSLHEISDLLKDDDNTTNGVSEDEFDPCTDYEEPREEEIYTITELSRILKNNNRGSDETEKVYDSILSIKSRSLKRNGSTRPPPRTTIKPKFGVGKAGGFVKPPLIHSESFTSEYVTISDFSDGVGDGISFKAGQPVKILEKNESGWWFIEIDNKEGWAPATYIEKSTTKVTPEVNKPRVTSPSHNNRIPSPINLKKPKSRTGSREDLTDENTQGSPVSPRRLTPSSPGRDSPSSPRRKSAVDAIGGLAAALKTKLNKGSKQPPTPPKKDFLEGGKQPPLPPPKKDFTDQSDWRESSGNINLNKLSIGIPKSQSEGVITKQALGGKKSLDRSVLLPPPPAPAKTSTQADNFKPSVPLKLPGNNTNTTAAPKPSFPPTKPKPPTKIAAKTVNDTETDASENKPVSGLASALKAKFEAKDSDKTKPAFPVTPPKPGTESGKNVRPKVNKKPNLGPLPDIPAPEQIARVKPSDASQSGRDSKTDSSDIGKPRVSDLANVLKDKFENRQSNSENDSKSRSDQRKETVSSTSPKLPSKPITALKTKQKPSRPVTPPSLRKPAPPGRPQSPNSPRDKLGLRRTTSPIAMETRSSGSPQDHTDSSLHPKKYSSRPLPAKPPATSNHDTNLTDNKPTKKAIPSLPTKPKLPVKATNSHGDSNTRIFSSQDNDNESKPMGVSGLANMLKGKLGPPGNTSRADNTKHEVPVSKPKTAPVISAKPTPNFNATSDSNVRSCSDVENNNETKGQSNSEVQYSAIADFDKSNEGEIGLVIGQTVELLEKSDGWWFVSDGANEGWVPSTYLEKVKSSTRSKSPVSNVQKFKSKQTVFRTVSDFTAENEGEVTVRAGETVSVMEQPEGGWWFIKVGVEEGWIPSSYLEEIMV